MKYFLPALGIMVLWFFSFVSSVSAQQETNKEKLLVIETDYGAMTVYLFNKTPLHKENMIKLAQQKYFDGTTFHRVIKDFMIQGGDINSKDDTTTNDGQGGINFNKMGLAVKAPKNKETTIPAEIKEGDWLVHTKGMLAGARMDDRVNPKRASSACQFYIVQGKKVSDADLTQAEQMIQQNQMQMYGQLEYLQSPEVQWVHDFDWAGLQKRNPDSVKMIAQKIETDMKVAFSKKYKLFKYTPEQRARYLEVGGTPHLDAQYTVFGQVIEGLDVMDKISNVEKGNADRPLKDVKMKVYIKEIDPKILIEKYKINLN